LPVIKMGKRVRFRQRDLDAWLEAQTLQPLNPRSNREGGAA
jgi:predicted DNA-binding transcriptional regulator AlpA